MKILECRNMSFGYGPDRMIMENVNLALDPGGFYLVKGPSGMGKSTLLRLLCRLEEPSGGEIFYRGRAYGEYDPPKLRREISYLQQTPTMDDGPVADNLRLPFTFAANQDLEPPGDAMLRRWLDMFLLTDIKLTDNAKLCSVGQKQRLSLIRNMLLEPAILLLDEPTSALDPESRKVVDDMTVHLNQEHGLTIVLVSHHDFSPESIETRILDIKAIQAPKNREEA